eukprot:GHVS01010862.1.p1 GENE.GHVS01010862.1~~GHVS01010862.1.p1  ORF type:complete len:118 (-),score=6.82 GHVS01010862.1:518-871(-)
MSSSCPLRKSTSLYRPVTFFVIAILLFGRCASPDSFRPISSSRFSTEGRFLQGTAPSLGCPQSSSSARCFRHSTTANSSGVVERERNRSRTAATDAACDHCLVAGCPVYCWSCALCQ